MATVHSSQATKCARRGLPEDEAPEHVPSAGELLIKQLARKQTDTSITLEQQLKEEKTFVRGVGLIRDFSSGTSSLKEFEEMQLRAEMMQEFEGQGLTREEVENLLDDRRQGQVSLATLAASEKQQCDPPPRCGGSLSRTEWEQASSVKPDSVETRLYKFAMQNMKPKPQTFQEPPDHPIHSLADMEHTLTKMAAADPQKLAKTIRRKRRQQVDSMADPANVHYRPPEPKSSLWDCIEPPVTVPRQPTKPVRVATCRKQTLYTVESGRIVPLDKAAGKNEKVESSEEKSVGKPFVAVGLSSQDTNFCARLTEQEIKQLPRFETYHRGTVSKILYIKNLSSNVRESDLVAIFAKFQEANGEKIIFRLMGGKMRGQAFVTFKNCDNATKALEEINGTILHGKPMVIQYGRHQT